MKNKKAVSVLTASMVIASNISTVVPVMALEQNTSNNMVESNEDVSSNEIVEINEEIESNEIEEDRSKGVNLEENQEHEEIEVEDIQIKGAVEKEDNNIVEIPKEKEQKKEYIEPRLSMGEPKIDKTTIIFPNIDVAFEDTKDLVIDYIPTENVEPNSVTYTYERGGTKEVVEGFNLDIKDLTLQEAQEVLSTLEINSNVSGTIKSRLNDMVISISDRPSNSKVKPTILLDNNKNSSWYSSTHQSNKTEVITIDFKGSRFLNSVGINSMVNNSNKTRTLLIEGKKEGEDEFKQIGRISKSISSGAYTDLISSVEEGYYTQIRLKHTAGYTPVMTEILFNGEQSTWLNSTVGSVDVVIEPIEEDTEAPILEGVKDIEIVEGTEINLLEGISANDNSDGDITDTVKVEVLKNNEVVTDYTGVGEYTLRYRVTDASGNETVLESKLIVKEDVDKVEINSIDISKGLENATVTSNRGYIIGFKVEATSKSDVTFKYTLKNGETVENTTNVLNFYDKYTTKEVQEILRGMIVESDSDIELKVTLGNLRDTMVYNEEEGHYYSLLKHSTKVNIDVFRNLVEKVPTFLNSKPYLANILSNDTLNVIRPLLDNPNYHWAKYTGTRKINNNNQSLNNTIGEFGELPHESLVLKYELNSDGLPLAIMLDSAHASGLKFADHPNSLVYSDVGLIEYGDPGERLPRPTKNTNDTTIVKSLNKLELGEPTISNGKITFPNAKGNIKDRANLQINIFDGYEGNEINYTLNKTKRSHIVPEVVVKGIDKTQMMEILSTLSFKIDYGQNLNIQVVLTDTNENVLYEGVTSADATSMSAIDGDLNTSWTEESTEGVATYLFDDPKEIDTVEAIHESVVNSKDNVYIVEGLLNGEWIEIGTQTIDYIDLLEQQMVVRVDATNGSYEGIRVRVNNTDSNVNVLDIKFNGEPKKSVTSKDIKVVGMEKDTEAPMIKISHGDMKLEKGSSIPNITASATDNDYLEPNLTSKITKTIIAPNGDVANSIDNMVVGDWIVRFEVEDRNGNKSKEEVKISIVADMTAPVLTGIRGGIIKQGEAYSLTSQVVAKDNIDGVITDNIVITYVDPNGVEQSTIDDSVKGDWKVKYSIDDSEGNHTEQEVTVTVETSAIIELGEPLVDKTNKTITFPNNIVDLQDNDTKKFRMRFSKGANSIVKYIVGGIEYTHTGNFTADAYNEIELKELLDTLTVEYTGTVAFETGIVNSKYIPIGAKGDYRLMDGDPTTKVVFNGGGRQVITLPFKVYMDSLYVDAYAFQTEVRVNDSLKGTYTLYNLKDKTVNLGNSEVNKIDLWHRNGSNNVDFKDILIGNFATRQSYNKVFIDLTPPTLTTNHSDMEVWQGIPVPNIVGSATDDIDGNLNAKVVRTITNPSGEVSDRIDETVVGEWLVHFEVSDKAGNTTTKEVRVNVKEDTEAPVITANYETLDVEKGKTVPTITANATDNSGQLGGAIVKTIIDPNGETQKAISNLVEGIWTVRYEVSDKIGNKTTKDVLVTITSDVTPPKIGISPNKDITIEQGRQLQTISASATDIVDGNLTSEIVTTIVNPSGEVVDSIDTMVLGKWLVKFEVEDKSGNKSESQRVVNVIKNLNAPTITGAYNRVVENGVPYDLNNIFTITDDNGLKDTSITVTNPSGEVTDSIDTTKEGDWSVNVVATDKSDNETNRTITIKVLGKASLDLGEHSKNGNVLTFPNAQIDIAEGMSKGLRFNFKENPSAVVSYTLNGKAYSHSGTDFVTQGITKYTQEEFIKSLKITSNSTVGFKVGLDGEKWSLVGIESATHPYLVNDNNQNELKAEINYNWGIIKLRDTTRAEKQLFEKLVYNSHPTGYTLKFKKNGVIQKIVSSHISVKENIFESIEFDEIEYKFDTGLGNAFVNNFKVGNKYIEGTTQEYREDMSAPLIKGARGGVIKQGNPFDLLKNVTVEDAEEGTITENLELICVAPDGTEYPNIDDSIFGEWTLKYSAKDSKNNSVEQIHKVIVEASDIIKLGEEYITEDGYISFRDNKASLQQGVTQKLRFRFNNATNSELRYTVGGTEKVLPITVNKDIVLPEYNEEEIREVLDTLKIKYTGHINFSMGVDNTPYMPIGTVSNKKELVDNIANTSNNLNGGVQIDLIGSTYIEQIDLGANFTNIVVELYSDNEIVDTVRVNSGRVVNTPFVKADKIVITGNGGNTSEIKISNYGTENTRVDKDIKSSLNLETDKDAANLVSGKFNGQGTFNKYELERKDNVTNEYKVIKMVSGGNFTDTLADILEPTIDIYLQRGKEGTAEVVASSEDGDVDYTYRVKAYNNSVLGGISNESLQTVYSSGIDGYVYEVNNNDSTELSNEINSKDGKLSLEGLTDQSYLHIKAIDKAGNSSKTLHIRLLDPNYNNKPVLKTDLNKVVGSGGDFDPMSGVSAYDFEDGDLTGKIKVEGVDKLNTNKVGTYKLVYSVEDSKGLKVSEVVNIHVTGTMDLDIADGKDMLDLEWSYADGIKKYKLYRSKADSTDYELYTELNSNATSYKDNYAIDTKAPVIEDIYEQDKGISDSKIKSKFRKMFNLEGKKLVIKDRDLATTYRYYVQGVNENGEVVNSTSVKSGKSNVGIKGYAFTIDEDRFTEAPSKLNALNIGTIEKAMEGKEGKILHIRALDNNGNIGDTVHYLIGSKYVTNHRPVIYGIAPRKIELGDSDFDIMEGISARDTEDGDITDKIEVISNFDLNKEGKYKVSYKVSDSHGNERIVSSYITVVKYNTLKSTAKKDINKIELDWSDIATTDKEVYYEVKKKNRSGNFAKIGTTEDTIFIDEMSSDVMGAMYNGNKRTENEDGTLSVEIKATDVGYSAEYQVVTRLKEDNTTIGTMTDVKYGTEFSVKGTQVGGIEGYSWHLSNMRLDEVDDIIDQESNIINFEPKDYEWLHVAPIDVYGNRGDTIHIQLKSKSIEGTDTLPTLLLEDTTIEIGSIFNPLKGVKANDKEDGDISDRVTYIGDVNTYLEGDYPVVYKVIDNDGNIVTKERIITVARSVSKPPKDEELEENRNHKIIVRDWRNPDYVELGTSNYNVLKGLEVESTKDGNIKDKLEYTTNLDLNNLGEYIVNFKAEDSIGNNIYFQRIVNVVKEGELPPTNEDGGSSKRPNVPEFSNFVNIDCKVGDKVNLLKGVTAKDEEDGDLTSQIKMTGTVNTLKPGIYRVQFKVTDSDSNTSYASRYVVVHEKDNNNGSGTLPPTEGGDSNDNGNNGGGTLPPPIEPEQPEPPKPPTEGESGSGNEGGNGGSGDVEETVPPVNPPKPPIEDEDDNKDETKPPTENEDTGKDESSNNENNDLTPKPPIGGSNGEDNLDSESNKPSINDNGNTNTLEKPKFEGNLNEDTNNDGLPDLNIDKNGDGVPDYNIDTNGDKIPDLNILSEEELRNLYKKTDNPKTGDTGILVSLFTLIASAGAIILNIRKKK